MGGRVTQRITVALAGNPNVGKSTLFNALTGLRQHTGNWPGKTVSLATGKCRRGDVEYVLTDLPGTYSLLGASEDEQVAAEYLEMGQADCTVIVCDGNALSRSLILALQVIEKVRRAVVCVNLMDEAERHGRQVLKEVLEQALGVPVVLTAAGREEGLGALLIAIARVVQEPPQSHSHWIDPVGTAQEIETRAVVQSADKNEKYRRQVDALLVSHRFGLPLLFLVLMSLVYLTVWGANYPSMALEWLFERLYRELYTLLKFMPPALCSFLLDGMYATGARVIAVMLPPMAIFFPLFTILEDIGYLPRMAFLMDRPMACCGGCGKQALTMCMGLGCNAVGVMGCRILTCPRARLSAMLTNAMIPCNGRFPALIVFATLAFSPKVAGLGVAACVGLGILGAMATTGTLNRRKATEGFLMEMPPFRKPRIGRILVRSLLDRTLFVAGRALLVAVPAGGVLWLCANSGVLGAVATFLEPVGRFLGMNGMMLLAFIFALPANELTIPVLLMVLTGAGSLQAVEGLGVDLLSTALTPKMAICAMVFTVFHWPCTTTLMTIWRETKSIKKTAAAFLIPTAVGCGLCAFLQWLL